MPVINPLQERCLRIFPSVDGSGEFYLTGGTALAHFYLQHRKSEDLDFFTSVEGLIPSFSKLLVEQLCQRGLSAKIQRGFHSFSEILVSLNNETTIIHLAQDAVFRFEPVCEVTEFPGLKVDPLKDIASNKLLALFGRAALRDFIDVYWLIQGGYFSKEQLIDFAKQKDPGLDLYWLGVAFAQISDYEQSFSDLTMLFKPVTFDVLSQFFTQWRDCIIKKLSAQ